MIAKSTGYERGPVNTRLYKKLSSHVKYLQHRKLGPDESREDRHIFSATQDDATRKEVVNEILRRTSTVANYHKLVLSPSQEEAKYIDDYRTLTRSVMKDLENHLGMTLCWYAVVQHHERENIDAPHVHIVIAGRGEKGDTGKQQGVRLYVKGKHPKLKELDDFEIMRTSALEHMDYAFYHQLGDIVEELDREDTLSSPQEQQPDHDVSKQPENERREAEKEDPFLSDGEER